HRRARRDAARTAGRAAGRVAADAVDTEAALAGVGRRAGAAVLESEDVGGAVDAVAGGADEDRRPVGRAPLPARVAAGPVGRDELLLLGEAAARVREDVGRAGLGCLRAAPDPGVEPAHDRGAPAQGDRPAEEVVRRAVAGRELLRL